MIDLRSDTVTQPSPEMRRVMSKADVGDDVYGDDPSINQLEEQLADMLEKEAGVFFPSGTQSNFAAMLCHCQRGEEVLVGKSYHVFIDEAHGSSVLGSIALTPLDVEPDGSLRANQIQDSIKPDDFHYPITRTLSLENTVSGKAVSLEQQNAAITVARKAGLSVHLDGARLFNAAIKLGVEAKVVSQQADTVSVCLSKGLGTPAGSVLVGTHEMMARARRWRKMLGGGMRQMGIIASAGLYALEHHIERLADDHRRAKRLGEALSEMKGLVVEQSPNQTNMVLITLEGIDEAKLQADLKTEGVIISPFDNALRLVTHLDIDDKGIDAVIHAFAQCLSRY